MSDWPLIMPNSPRHTTGWSSAIRTRITPDSASFPSTLIETAVGSARSDPEQMYECLDNARIHLRLTLDEARQALSDLRHDSFEHGLPGALAEMAKAVGGEKGIPVTVDLEGEEVPLPDATNRALILVAREAVRNAI